MYQYSRDVAGSPLRHTVHVTPIFPYRDMPPDFITDVTAYTGAAVPRIACARHSILKPRAIPQLDIQHPASCP
ncbi:hypothetical protein SXCC_03516 [Gluconacetobacter sp. SXCC-1]|nr:hypothetical protein SXCC_03516 [Gluconacetobacter sp. SXCC-1]